MDQKLASRLLKIKKLIDTGSTEGERKAAKNALNRLISKHSLQEKDINDIGKNWYGYSYASIMEVQLLQQLVEYFLDNSESILETAHRTTFDPERLRRCKLVRLHLEYLDFITIEACYGYFRKHMKSQWVKLCAPVIARCRKEATRNKKRLELQSTFFNQYIIASKLVDPKFIKRVDTANLSKSELEKLLSINGIEGGQYNTQIQSGHMLTEASTEKLSTFSNSQLGLFS